MCILPGVVITVPLIEIQAFADNFPVVSGRRPDDKEMRSVTKSSAKPNANNAIYRNIGFRSSAKLLLNSIAQTQP
ncbi:MAG: hypothetical protein HBSAPP01_10930 [Candidatus Brocadia sapporoensis]|nr:MAG: hypothetical protein HBSAPP01_10930 [Candidatus Brocadia sapporoensis]